MRSCEEIRAFTLAIGRYLRDRFASRALVVACNTATAAGVDSLRVANPDLPVVGMEPGVKPAVQASRSGHVGVLATAGTLANRRFATLIERHAGEAEIITQPCPDLVASVEAGDFDSPTVRAQVERYVAPLLSQGVDVLVLGCTHYPVLRPLIADVVGPSVTIIDAGPAVARQVARVAPAANPTAGSGATVLCLTTGNDEAAFGRSARQILNCYDGGAAVTATVTTGRLYWKDGDLTDHADSAN